MDKNPAIDYWTKLFIKQNAIDKHVKERYVCESR